MEIESCIKVQDSILFEKNQQNAFEKNQQNAKAKLESSELIMEKVELFDDKIKETEPP